MYSLLLQQVIGWFIVFFLSFLSLFILFKYFFKLQFNLLTLAGVLLVGSLIAGFFDGTYRWIGFLIYIALVGTAFYKKFHLHGIKIFIAMALLLGVSFASNYFLLQNLGLLSGSRIPANVSDWETYSSSQDSFSVSFPGNPRVDISNSVRDSAGRNYSSRSYESADSKYSVWVYTYADFDFGQMSDADKIVFLKGRFPSPSGLVITPPVITPTTFNGEFAIRYSDPKGIVNHFVLFKKNKLYSLQAILQENDVQGIERFFGSFELH